MFQKATKTKCKLRLAIFGPSGAGKTFSALRIAKGLGGRIAVIDTEHGSASKYADKFEFDVCELNQNQNIETTVRTINEASGYDVLIIDSMSHSWQELLVEIDRLAKQKYKGNTWSAWSDGTPKQKELVNAILSYPGHVIATMRSKTEWETEKTGNGKNRPVKVGLAPEQGKGIEYEFDMLMEITTEHVAFVSKDRTGKYQDANIEKPGEQLGQELAAWLNEGIAPQPQQQPNNTPPQNQTPPPQNPPQQPSNKSFFWGSFQQRCQAQDVQVPQDKNALMAVFTEMCHSATAANVANENGWEMPIPTAKPDSTGWLVLNSMLVEYDIKSAIIKYATPGSAA